VKIIVPEPVAVPIKAFDEGADRFFDQLRGRKGPDLLFYGASAVGDHSMIWVALAGLRYLRGGPVNKQAARRALIGIPLESILVNAVIKSFFRRGRPAFTGERPHRLRRPRTSSFPSGHATAAFAAAGLLSDDDPLWPLYYAAALVVASSRAYVKIHHASDVVAGIAVGVALGRLGRKIHPLAVMESSRRAGG
jgi:undecaprenyl-diphosphatase